MRTHFIYIIKYIYLSRYHDLMTTRGPLHTKSGLPAISLRISIPDLLSSLLATYSLATRFIPSRSGVTSATWKGKKCRKSEQQGARCEHAAHSVATHSAVAQPSKDRNRQTWGITYGFFLKKTQKKRTFTLLCTCVSIGAYTYKCTKIRKDTSVYV